MVYTLTLNPSLDYIIKTDRITVGEVNRTTGEKIVAGGKGINVSVVLKRLGADTKALGFVGGFTGTEIEKRLADEYVLSDFVRIDGDSRINVKVVGEGGITELNAAGPNITKENVDALFEKLSDVKSDDYVVIAGTLPKTMEREAYGKLAEKLSGKCRIVADTTGAMLLSILKYKPFLVKPNLKELSEFFDTEIEDKDTAAEFARKMHEMGAENVLVSMGNKGALLYTSEGEIFVKDAIKGNGIYTVGAGDSMVAGFLYGTICNLGMEKALEYGIAAGSATAFSDSLASKEEILSYVK